MSSTLPKALLDSISSKYKDLDAKLSEARWLTRNTAKNTAVYRKAKADVAYLTARLDGMLDIMIETNNYDAPAMTREQLYHGTGFAPGALFIQIN